MRGIAFIQIPTSFLAMVDSSIGGKTGIDTPAGKNLLGTFYKPKAVFIDTNLLKKQRSAIIGRLVNVIFANDIKSLSCRRGFNGGCAYFPFKNDKETADAAPNNAPAATSVG